MMVIQRNFRAEIDTAAKAGDWEKISQLYDERRCAEVDHDEQIIADWIVNGEDAIFNRNDSEV